MATITDILISELDQASLPATGADELVINQIDQNSNEFVTRKISWQEVGYSIQDLAGDPNFPGVKQIYFDDGLEIEPSITFKNDVDTGIYRPILSVPAVAITVDNSEALRCVALSTKRHTGLNFANNDNNIPIDVLHVKKGGVYIQYGDQLETNTLHLTSYTLVGGNTAPFINTPGVNDIAFGTQSKVRGRFTGKGNFHIFGALGVGDYDPLYSHGDDGDVLISSGTDKSPKWIKADDFIINNKDIIIDILVDDDDFWKDLFENLDIGYGLEYNERPDVNGNNTTFLDNTFIFDHLPSL